MNIFYLTNNHIHYNHHHTISPFSPSIQTPDSSSQPLGAFPLTPRFTAMSLRSRCADSAASASAMTKGGASGASRPPRRPRTRAMPKPWGPSVPAAEAPPFQAYGGTPTQKTIHPHNKNQPQPQNSALQGIMIFLGLMFC